MSNYAANTLGQQDISDDMVRSCHRLQKVAESVPIFVIYGGPEEMWPNVVRCDGQERFETKAHCIRNLLRSSGHIQVIDGKADFRAFFDGKDLDDNIGHIRGMARDKAIQWMTKQVMGVSNHLLHLFRVKHQDNKHPNVQHGLSPEDPMALKFAMIGRPPLHRAEIEADWRARTLSKCRPHIFLLAGPDTKCAAQQAAASNMLEQLGWEPKLVMGIPSHVKLPQPRSHWAWACEFLPKLGQIIAASNCSDDEVVLLGEESPHRDPQNIRGV